MQRMGLKLAAYVSRREYRMPWKLMDDPSKDEISAMQEQWKKKARFLIDESLDQELVEVLRVLGWNAVGAMEANLIGKSDEDVIAYAWRERRMLLTKDRDFLDNRRFPEHRNSGIVILPDSPIDAEHFTNAIRQLVHIIAPLSKGYQKTKVDLTSSDTIVISRRNNKTGAIERQRFKIGQNDELYFWEPNNET